MDDLCFSCRGTDAVRDLGNGEMRPCIVCRADDYEAWADGLRPATRWVATLDDQGRCCGRKPLVYKRPRPRLYCLKCCATIDPATGRQVASPMWRADGDAFVAEHPTAAYARRATQRTIIRNDAGRRLATPTPTPAAPIGCICPPISEQTCQRPDCPEEGGEVMDTRTPEEIAAEIAERYRQTGMGYSAWDSTPIRKMIAAAIRAEREARDAAVAAERERCARIAAQTVES